MITDRETNFVFFSSLVKERPELRRFWRYLEKTLKKAGIQYGFIHGTNDLWCRDYMPVQVANDKFVQFVFDPAYYKTKKHRHLLTDIDKVEVDAGPVAHFEQSLVLVDGGNLVRSKNRVILTDRIFKENEAPREEIEAELKRGLQVSHLYFIPTQPYDTSGHSDGMVRLLDDSTLLVADYGTESNSWKSKYQQALSKTGLRLIPFPNVISNRKNIYDDYTAIGCYINFAWIGDTILFPQFDLPEDKVALQEANKVFKEYKVLPVPAAELAIAGGVLNCATWNIRV